MTMAEHIDHADQARTILTNIQPYELDGPGIDRWLAIAQVHATLALVEQQRIANLQVERDEIRRRYEGRHDAAATLAVDRLHQIDNQIVQGLGL